MFCNSNYIFVILRNTNGTVCSAEHKEQQDPMPRERPRHCRDHLQTLGSIFVNALGITFSELSCKVGLVGVDIKATLKHKFIIFSF